MTAHRRAWTLRASLVAVLAAGGLFGIASPALAAAGDPSITNYNVDGTDLQPGAQANMTFTVAGSTTPPSSGQTTITITSSLAPDITIKVGSCTGAQCSSVTTLDVGGTKDFAVTIMAAQNPTGVQPGGQKSGTIKIEVDPQNGNKVTKSQAITLEGPTQTQGPSYVTQVSGFVKDVATGSSIGGATVTLQDSSGHNFTTTTNTLGAYTFKSTQANPIAPGTLAIGAQKNGYQDKTESATGQAGQSLTAPELRLESTASTAPSDAASVPVAAPPSDPNSNLSVAPLSNDNTASSGGGSGFSMILIVAGVLLVLLGIGAIVLILMRRRRDGDDGDEVDDAPPPRRGPSPVPASRGSYRGGPDPTAVVRGGAYNDRTMVSRGGPSIADAPTTVQRPVPVDEYPDPYGAPPPRSPQPYGSGGYGDGGQYGSGGYGSGGYDDGGYGDRRGSEYGGPGAPYSGIYGQPEEPPARGGYGDNGYGDRRGGDYGGGHRDSGGYEPGYRPGGGYDKPTSGSGYRDSGSGYRDSGSGYGDSGGYGGRGSEYDEPRGGYDRRGGSQPPPEPRGRLDWLDD